MSTPSDKAKGMYRKDGHDTSRDAAIAILSKKTALQQIVFAKFLEAGVRGLTLYELEERCNDHSSTMRTRCSELVSQRLLIDTKTKRRVNGRDRKVWRIRTPADDAESDLVDLMHGGKVDPLQALLGRGFHTAFADTVEVEAYLRINGFRYVGQDGPNRIYRTLKGHHFSYDPTASSLVGELSWQPPEQNRGRPDGDEALVEDPDPTPSDSENQAGKTPFITTAQTPTAHPQNP